MVARPTNEWFRSLLLELIERRYDMASTISCTQFTQEDWHQRLGGGIHVDAIMVALPIPSFGSTLARLTCLRSPADGGGSSNHVVVIRVREPVMMTSEDAVL